MTQQIFPTCSSDAEFHLRVRQAILAAQTSARQFGLLLIKCPMTFDQVAQVDDDCSLFMQFRNSLRDSDTIMQLPDHSLGVLLPYARSTEDVELVIWRILAKIEEAFSNLGEAAPIIGAALFPDHASSAVQLIKCAEKALKHAQNSGSRYAIHSFQLHNNS